MAAGGDLMLPESYWRRYSLKRVQGSTLNLKGWRLARRSPIEFNLMS
jgi:hypothetical protein